ncbi:hypothetical protein A2U01_0050839, partial [Trifolium medium]|nr:hypothetical protein [Trifolium medium]
MTNLRKKQVLHFPNAYSRCVLANATYIDLKSEDTDYRYRCPVNTSERSEPNGAYEKHIGKGWYEYLLSHRPRVNDKLLFELFPDTYELNVKLERRRNLRRNF